jgi:alanyl-tRNA synthetase
LEEFIASSTGLKRSQTLKDVRKHVRDRTRNLDDAASVDSGKSKDEAVSKIRNVLSELDQLKKRNEELEAMLKGTNKNDENETWKEIEVYFM